jgi:acetyl-CoA carboxylase biotin carboxyl carrier protein
MEGSDYMYVAVARALPHQARSGQRLSHRPKPAAPVSTQAFPAKHSVEAPLGEGEIAIRAPMLGTFYRSPAPGDPPFVELGKRVQADDTVCLIEVMKLFSSINAGVDGVVTRIPVENGTMVEFGQMLIVIATSP